jgi:hypothetical protein
MTACVMLSASRDDVFTPWTYVIALCLLLLLPYTPYQVHVAIPEVQARGCNVLGSLASDSPANQRAIIDAGGLVALQAAMNAHKDVPVVHLLSSSLIPFLNTYMHSLAHT